MKLTLQLQSFLDEQCNAYCEQMTLRKPLLITNIKDLPKSIRRSASQSMRYDRQCLGLHWPSIGTNPDCIFIDIGRHTSKKQLIETLVHELVHSKFKTAIHDKDFYHKIKLVLAGKRYK